MKVGTETEHKEDDVHGVIRHGHHEALLHLCNAFGKVQVVSPFFLHRKVIGRQGPGSILGASLGANLFFFPADVSTYLYRTFILPACLVTTTCWSHHVGDVTYDSFCGEAARLFCLCSVLDQWLPSATGDDTDVYPSRCLFETL